MLTFSVLLCDGHGVGVIFYASFINTCLKIQFLHYISYTLNFCIMLLVSFKTCLLIIIPRLHHYNNFIYFAILVISFICFFPQLFVKLYKF